MGKETEMAINVFANYPKPEKLKDCTIDNLREGAKNVTEWFGVDFDTNSVIESRAEHVDNHFMVLICEAGESYNRREGCQLVLDSFREKLSEYLCRKISLQKTLENAVKSWKYSIQKKYADGFCSPYTKFAPGKLLAVVGGEEEVVLVLWGMGKIETVRNDTVENLSASRKQFPYVEGFNDNDRLRYLVLNSPIPDAVILYTHRLAQTNLIGELYEHMWELSKGYDTLPRGAVERYLNDCLRGSQVGVGGYWITGSRQMATRQNMDAAKVVRDIPSVTRRNVSPPSPVQRKSSVSASPLYGNRGTSDAAVYQLANQDKAELERKLQEARIALERTEKEYETTVQKKAQVLARMSYLEQEHCRRMNSLTEHRNYLKRKETLLRKTEEEGACP